MNNTNSTPFRLLPRFRVSILAAALMPALLEGQAVEYAGGSGAVLEGTKSRDGEFAVVLDKSQDNVIVSLREKRQVMKLTAEDDWQFPYFPGLNHGSLDVTWGPDQEGNRFGILMYGAKWETAKVILVDVNGDFGAQSDMLPLLQAAALGDVRGRGVPNPDHYAFSFSVAGVEVPEGDMVIRDPLDILVSYVGQVPKSEDAEVAEGTFRIRLSRGNDGPVASQPGGAAAPAAAGAAKGPDAFKALRKKIDAELEAQVEAGTVKKVRVHRKSEIAGRKLSYMGYVEGTILKQLVYVDSEDDDNESYVIYYWQDGFLVSAYEVRKGRDTEMSEVARTTEIYNFEDQKLVSWLRDDVAVNPDDISFADVGSGVLDDSIERAGVIYLEIGAD